MWQCEAQGSGWEKRASLDQSLTEPWTLGAKTSACHNGLHTPRRVTQRHSTATRAGGRNTEGSSRVNVARPNSRRKGALHVETSLQDVEQSEQESSTACYTEQKRDETMLVSSLRPSTPRNATGRSNQYAWRSTWKRGTMCQHCQEPRAKNHNVWSCDRCRMQVCPVCKRNSTNRCGAFPQAPAMPTGVTGMSGVDATIRDTWPDTLRDTQLVDARREADTPQRPRVDDQNPVRK